MQNSLLKPRIIDVEALGAGHAKVVMEPFERGYGHTLGNALRRVLLSSMVGYAPTEVTIAGVVHEYSSLDGVQEDVVDLLLNLKGVVFKVHNRDSVTLTLKKEGEGAVLASDIDLPHDVELINPDHVIAHLTAGGKLDMQIKVEKGRGYVPGNVRRLSEDTNKTIGRIILDASFSPVRRVSYFVESARVEQRTDLDKLIINIETNGVISPEEAIRPRHHDVLKSDEQARAYGILFLQFALDSVGDQLKTFTLHCFNTRQNPALLNLDSPRLRPTLDHIMRWPWGPPLQLSKETSVMLLVTLMSLRDLYME